MDNLTTTVFRAMLRKSQWAQYSDLLSGQALTNNIAQAVREHMAALHGRTTGDLNPTMVRLEIQSAYPVGDSRAEELLGFVQAIEDTEEVEDSAIRGYVEKFVSRSLLEEAARYIATHLSSPELDAAIPADLVGRAVEISEKVDSNVVDYHTADLPGQADIRTAICSLGFSPHLDRVLAGGVGGGDMLVILAPPCRGKTSYLCSIGARAAAQGRGVLHVTLEISARRVIRRYDQVLTGMTPDELIQSQLTVSATRKAVAKAGGRVWIKNRAYMDTTPLDIKGMIRRMHSEGMEVDFVIIDYLELMKPNPRSHAYRKDQRHSFGELGQDLRAVAVGLDIPVVTAWQVNRVGSNMDTVELLHVSESWDVVKHADTILAINQSSAEAAGNRARIGILKQRESSARMQIYLKSDMDRCQIRELPNEELINEQTSSFDSG